MRIFAQAVTECRWREIPVPPKGDNTWQLVAVLPVSSTQWDSPVVCYWQREQDLPPDYRAPGGGRT